MCIYVYICVCMCIYIYIYTAHPPPTHHHPISPPPHTTTHHPPTTQPPPPPHGVMVVSNLHKDFSWDYHARCQGLRHDQEREKKNPKQKPQPNAMTPQWHQRTIAPRARKKHTRKCLKVNHFF